ncbi:MAG: hypothetical protein GXP57_02355 [Deltaproteobacteria bacterium]|nr:hypothetical protein [Deltaproteobacteria bacterium]
MKTRFAGSGVKFFLTIGLACLVLIMLSLPARLRAGELVTARYLRAQGRKLVVKIIVGSPPPPSLIVIQNLPAGVAIRSSLPPAKSVNAAGGKAKWLLREVQAGTIMVRMSLDRAVSAAAIAGEIRYREPRSGTMVTLPITKP